MTELLIWKDVKKNLQKYFSEAIAFININQLIFHLRIT